MNVLKRPTNEPLFRVKDKIEQARQALGLTDSNIRLLRDEQGDLSDSFTLVALREAKALVEAAR